MLSKRMLLVALTAPLMLALVACGGSKKSSTDSGSTPTGADLPAATATSSSNNSDASLANCPQYANLAALAAKGFGGTGTTSSSSTLDKKALDELVKNSPKEIKSDMQTFVDALISYMSTLDSLGVNLSDPASFAKLASDPAKMSQLEAAADKMETEKVQKALDRIEAYFEGKCN
ncbi:MAG TPA: hypothetical protein VI759_00185 [Dehalococcoidia bacterium]|nr:hypothetical protein [Dehalococcoidia bacterium]